MTQIHIDWETRSRADIKKVGAAKYAEDPSTIILLAAVSKDDGPVYVWDYTDPESEESANAWALLWRAANDPDAVNYAHNAPFEMAISNNLWQTTFGFPPPKLHQWRCTAAMGRRAALPSALGELGAVLKISGQKDKRGEQLIRIFCIPRSTGKLKGKFILPTDEGTVTVAGEKVPISQAWQWFREYNRQDVVAERQVHKKLAAFELKGNTLRAFQFDLRMNQRGLPVNVEALRNAQQIVLDASEHEIARCRELCGLNPTQVKKLLPWLQERGYPAYDLREESMDAVLEGTFPDPIMLEPEAREVLSIRYRVAFAAVKKIPAMLKIVCADGRIRGTLMWSGAIRTHRWSGKLVQPQNYKRPPKHLEKHCPDIYKAICAGWDHEMIYMVWGNAVEAVAACIRNFIQDEECEFLDADYSNIEARITPWLAGQDSLLQIYRDGRDPYSEMAAKVFDKPEAIPSPEECAAKDVLAYKVRYSAITGSERFVGKQCVLLCGFQGGWEKLQATCEKYGQTVDNETCKAAVAAYREENAEVASMWKSMNRAAVQAIENPGERYKVRGKITFYMAGKLPFPALLMRLPSGHHLVYPYPELITIWMFNKQKYSTRGQAEAAYKMWKVRFERDKKAGKLTEEELEEKEPRVWETQQISFLGIDINHQWGRQTTYGGKLLENAVQATAGDFITHGVLQAEKEGHEIFLVVHDQALSSFRPEKGHTVEVFRTALCSLPEWAGDFPLEATCSAVPYYLKD